MSKKVMIVDDDQELMEELRETLNLSGYDTVGISDPLRVVDQAAALKPDIILMDLKMPGKSGFQVADELRRLSTLMNVPIIAMTGFFKEGYGPLMHICGIKKCINKPFNALDVINQIEEALREVS